MFSGIYKGYNFVARLKYGQAATSPSLEIIITALAENEKGFFAFRSLVIITPKYARVEAHQVMRCLFCGIV